MRAFSVIRYGKNVPMQMAELPEPCVKHGEVLVQIHCAGVNPLDSLIKSGAFKLFLPYKTPFINGHDVAGVVLEVGSKVGKFKVGDEVYARLPDYKIGGFSEYICINEDSLALKPKTLSMAEAGSIPLVGLTAWQALVEIGKIKKGQKVFIQAGSGGVGCFAIQLAKHLGAYVATTTSTTNIELVKRLGADLVIDYKNEDFASILKEYDFVLHNSKNPQVLKNSLKILRRGGKLVSLVGPPTPEFAKKMGLAWHVQLLTKLLSFGARREAEKLGVKFSFLFMKASGLQLEQLSTMIDAGFIKPVVDKVFEFEKTNEALSYVETGRAKGKVVIKVV